VEIWNRVPLDDQELGTRLFLNRRQVSNLRTSARLRLVFFKQNTDLSSARRARLTFCGGFWRKTSVAVPAVRLPKQPMHIFPKHIFKASPGTMTS
jgi:hypothetical protein